MRLTALLSGLRFPEASATTPFVITLRSLVLSTSLMSLAPLPRRLVFKGVIELAMVTLGRKTEGCLRAPSVYRRVA